MDTALVGVDGYGFRFEQLVDSEDEEEVAPPVMWGVQVESETDMTTDSGIEQESEEEEIDGDDEVDSQGEGDDDSTCKYSDCV